MYSAFIGLGTNIGNRLENLTQAINYLIQYQQIEIVKISSVYESEPMYYANQNSFYNAVLEITTSFDPLLLLKELKKIEKKMGRDFESIENGPRIIDLDIEYFDDLIMESDDLVIPHPRLYERLFVLKPLLELNKKFRCCKTGKTIEILLQECLDISKIEKIGKITL